MDFDTKKDINNYKDEKLDYGKKDLVDSNVEEIRSRKDKFFKKTPIAIGITGAFISLLLFGIGLFFNKSANLENKEAEIFVGEIEDRILGYAINPTQDGKARETLIKDSGVYSRTINYSKNHMSAEFKEETKGKLSDLRNSGNISGFGAFPTKDGSVKLMVAKDQKVYHREVNYKESDYSQNFKEINESNGEFYDFVKDGGITAITGFVTKNGWVKQMMIKDGKLYQRTVNYNIGSYSQEFKEVDSNNVLVKMIDSGEVNAIAGYTLEDGWTKQIIIKDGEYYQREVNYNTNNFKQEFVLIENYFDNAFFGEEKISLSRFGLGNVRFLNLEQGELDELELGWYHNWEDNRIRQPDIMEVSTDYLDFYALIGGYRSNQCSRLYSESEDFVEKRYRNQVRDDVSSLEDGTVVWVGNEIGWDDQRDPATYAKEYDYCYRFIKEINPTLKVAVGANPGTLSMKYPGTKIDQWVNNSRTRWSKDKEIDYYQYYSYVLERYQANFGKELPVDAFVIHMYPFHGGKPHDVAFVKSEITKFRRMFMTGEKAKLPLIIKETNTVDFADDSWSTNSDGYYKREIDAMKNLFNLYLNYKDNDLGNPYDGGRMVQRWAWFNSESLCKNYDVIEDRCIDRRGDSLYYCANLDKKNPDTTGCNAYQYISRYGEEWKNYVHSISYDYLAPQAPTVNYELKDGKYILKLNSRDNSEINTYVVSIGSSEGDTDVMFWEEIGPNGVYEINRSEMRGKFLNVKSRDDGYNESLVGSILLD